MGQNCQKSWFRLETRLGAFAVQQMPRDEMHRAADNMYDRMDMLREVKGGRFEKYKDLLKKKLPDQK